MYGRSIYIIGTRHCSQEQTQLKSNTRQKYCTQFRMGNQAANSPPEISPSHVNPPNSCEIPTQGLHQHIHVDTQIYIIIYILHHYRLYTLYTYNNRLDRNGTVVQRSSQLSPTNIAKITDDLYNIDEIWWTWFSSVQGLNPISRH